MSKKEEPKTKKSLSMNESKLVSKIVHSIKMGWMILEPTKEKTDPFEDFFKNV